jgi:hypothetical protein
MRIKGLKISCAVILVFLGCVSCASTQRRDIESELIAAMAARCKTVEIKEDGGREVHVINPTQKLSGNGCPIALIRGWRDGVIIKEKEVEICECKDR